MQWDYKDHTITIDENGWFNIAGPLQTDDRKIEHSGSLSGAREAINARIELEFKKTRMQTKIQVPGLNSNGQPCTVTGLHLGDGRLLGIEESKFWPPVEWIAKLLREKVEIGRRSREIDKLIAPFQVTERYAYHPTAAEYEAKVEAFLQSYADRKAKAEAAAP